MQVADLGAAGELAGRLAGAVGTPAFRAPEAQAAADLYDGEVWHHSSNKPLTSSSQVSLANRFSYPGHGITIVTNHLQNIIFFIFIGF